MDSLKFETITDNGEFLHYCVSILSTIECMDLSFEQLKSMVVFARVVEHGSFSAAAKQLDLTRAVVSYHIKRLESQLGLKLLNRSTRTHALTEAGQIYYQSCHVIAEQASMAQKQIDSFRDEPEGLLKISCPVNLGLELVVPALNQFRQLFPRIELDVQLTDDVIDILRSGIDLAIRGAPLPDSGLQARQLARLSTCLCASPDYLRQHGSPATPTDLETHDWVIYSPGSTDVVLRRGSRSYSIRVSGSITTNNAAARTAFVVGGHGLGRIPNYDAMPRLNRGELDQVLAGYALDDIVLYGVFPPGTASTKKLRVLLDHLSASFRVLNQNRNLQDRIQPGEHTTIHADN